MMMPEANGEPDFDALLRDNDYIPDDGFTQSVLNRLPDPAHRTSRRKSVLAIAFTLAAMICAFQAYPVIGEIVAGIRGVLAGGGPEHLVTDLVNPFCLAALLAGTFAVGFLLVRLLTYCEENWASP